MSNCYWVDEFGASQLCFEVPLPPLPEYWVRFDDSSTIDGSPAARTYETAYYGDGRAAAAVGLASDGDATIVAATSYPLGDYVNTYSTSSFGVQTSTDHGFTYGNIIEYTPWQQGTQPGGYDPMNGNWYQTWYHHGTAIDYDPIAGKFVLCREQGNNTGYSVAQYPPIITATSTDGTNWSTNTATNQKNNVLHVAAYDGQIWFLGNNDWQSLFGTEGYYYIISHSSNDGANFTNTDLGTDGGVVTNRNAPREEFCNLSANSAGCHVIAEVYDLNVPNDFGLYYWRPTSYTTWAAPILLWDHDNVDFPGFPGRGADDFSATILASKVDPNIVVSVKMDYTWTGAWVRRSIDGGVNFSNPQQIVQLSNGIPGYEEFDWNQVASNIFDLVELSDGRFVLVMVFEAFWPDYDEDSEGTNENYGRWTAYSLSEDEGATWGPVVYLSPWWTADPVYYGERVKACAKGVDVVVNCTHRAQGTYNLIFRPTATPDPTQLVPPTLTLPATPTTGWP